MQRVHLSPHCDLVITLINAIHRHTHVSLRDDSGKNIFAVSEAELSTGRSGAANDDVKFLSEEAEHFLAGILDGIADGTRFRRYSLFLVATKHSYLFLC